ncbi:MAG: MBL fold metallo-hydrolase [Clostridia bacterium]|nr:MBL fold metallo-hydrolase [Clostridia bacterium]
MKKYIKAVSVLLSILMLFAFASGCAGTGSDNKNTPKPTEAPADNTPESEPTAEPTPEPTPEPKKGFELHFIDIGTGDGMLLICDGEAMIIDSGNVGRGETMVNYTKSQGVEKLKYLMVTHGHADHVGGMPEIIDAFPFETMFINVDQRCDEEPWLNLLGIIEQKGITPVNPAVGDVYTLGGGSFKILTPLKEDKNNLNNNSIGIKFTYGTNTFLLLGDSQQAVETQLLKEEGVDLRADVFKADHHASNAGNVRKFLEAVAPTYICVQVGTENKLGYPDKTTISRLEKNCEELYRNDVHGTVVFYSDGSTITVKTEKTPEAAE